MLYYIYFYNPLDYLLFLFKVINSKYLVLFCRNRGLNLDLRFRIDSFLLRNDGILAPNIFLTDEAIDVAIVGSGGSTGSTLPPPLNDELDILLNDLEDKFE